MTGSFFRRVWRWHFWAGLIACPVLLVVALTGAAYAFKDEAEDWLQSGTRFVEPSGGHLPVSGQLSAAARPEWTTTRVTLPADPRRATLVQVERPGEPARVVDVNPFTATVTGEGAAKSAFFAFVLKLHRSLFAGTAGRVAVELTTSWTLVLLVTGVYLWLPKAWGRVGGVWLPRLRRHPYVALRDLHAIGGLLLTPVLALLAVTGLFFTAVWLPAFNAATNGTGDFPRELRARPMSSGSASTAGPGALDAAVEVARARFPGRTLELALPRKPTDALAFTVRGGGPSVGGLLEADPATGAVLREARAEDLPPAAQARLYAYPVHVGSVGGLPTKVLACAAGLGLAGLGVSGVGMWLVRRPRGRWGVPRPSSAPAPTLAVVLILLLAVALPTVGASLVLVIAGGWVAERFRRAAAADAEDVSIAGGVR